MHPAANPVQKGRNLLNASAQINEGTATIGCIKKKDSKRLQSKTAMISLNKLTTLD